jgi:hypothetical protein
MRNARLVRRPDAWCLSVTEFSRSSMTLASMSVIWAAAAVTVSSWPGPCPSVRRPRPAASLRSELWRARGRGSVDA